MVSLDVKISYILCMIKYDFTQWPKTLYHTIVYEINSVLRMHHVMSFQEVSKLLFHQLFLSCYQLPCGIRAAKWVNITD